MYRAGDDDPGGGHAGGHVRSGFNRDDMAGGGNGAVHSTRYHERLVRRNFSFDDEGWADVRAVLHEAPPTDEGTNSGGIASRVPRTAGLGLAPLPPRTQPPHTA